MKTHNFTLSKETAYEYAKLYGFGGFIRGAMLFADEHLKERSNGLKSLNIVINNEIHMYIDTINNVHMYYNLKEKYFFYCFS